MTRPRQITLGLAMGRVAFGAGLLAAPGRVASPWLGSDAARRPSQVAIRGLGARDIALSAGAFAAALDGGPVRPWLIALVAGDLADIGATLAAGDSLPDRSRTGTLALAGGSALAGAIVAAVVDA